MRNSFLQIAPDWRQALALKKIVEDRIAKGITHLFLECLPIILALTKELQMFVVSMQMV